MYSNERKRERFSENSKLLQPSDDEQEFPRKFQFDDDESADSGKETFNTSIPFQFLEFRAKRSFRRRLD